MKSTTILGAIVFLGFMSFNAQAGQEFRKQCKSTTTSCGISNTATATARAVTVANDSGAVVGDDITLVAYGIVGGGNAVKSRTFTVISTPVTSAANLSDGGYIIDVDDSALPPAPNLRGPGISVWFVWNIGLNPADFYNGVWVASCAGRPDCW